MKYKQMSIYDFIGEEDNFLPEEKSQEVQPSETDPQVDEAQEEKRIPIMFRHEWKTESPSSALDTRKTWEKIVDFEASLTKEPPEDTDNVVTNSTLFSVGECARVVNPYHYGHEDWDYLEDFKGKVVKLSELMRVSAGVQTFKCYFLHEIARRDNYFNSNELQKI
ncbi:hypothetical protein [Bacillus cereus]